MRGHTRAGLFIAPILAAGLLGCSSAATPHTASTPTSHATPARLDWSKLRNPIVSSPDRSVKDPALVSFRGTWFLLFSAVDAQGTWRIGLEHSSDLRNWSAMGFLPHDPKVEGEASPDVVRAPNGRYVVTYQSFPHDRSGGLSKLYYRTTSDFERFSPSRPLGLPLNHAPGDRVIDAALAWTPAGLLLGYKAGTLGKTLAFEIARSPSGSLDGPWQLVGRPDIRVYGDTIENDQFIRVDGHWKLVATSNQLDRPFLFDLTGEPGKPKNWLHWTAGRELVVPQEAWNRGTGITGATYEHANGAYLLDRRAIDGHFYLVYEDAPEMSSFSAQGHGVFGIARSTDLVHWTVPPG